jgi:hypothetical protein
MSPAAAAAAIHQALRSARKVPRNRAAAPAGHAPHRGRREQIHAALNGPVIVAQATGKRAGRLSTDMGRAFAMLPATADQRFTDVARDFAGSASAGFPASPQTASPPASTRMNPLRCRPRAQQPWRWPGCLAGTAGGAWRRSPVVTYPLGDRGLLAWCQQG